LADTLDLTNTDRKLLLALKQDARASVTTLAGQIGVARATVQASIKRLVELGIIQRFTIDIDSRAEGELVHAIMTIEVQGILTSKVISALKRMPEIVSLHSTNGSWDLVAQIETPNLTGFDVLLRRTREIEGILTTETSILLNAAK